MGLDGYVVLAILALFFIYFLPSVIRSAQVVAEARIEDRFSGELHIIATAGQGQRKEVAHGRTYIHPPRISETPMNTPVARKLAAADARRVAAARAARAAAASKRSAAAKRRMLTLSIVGALTISSWILTAMVNFPWAVSAVLTAATVGVVELGRRAAAAGVRADEVLAQKVKEAEQGAQVVSPLKASEPQGDAAPADLAETVAEAPSSLRVEVDPEQDSSWTPVPVPPPAYTLKPEVRRKEVEPYEAKEEPAVAPVEAPETEKKVPGSVPSMPKAPAAEAKPNEPAAKPAANDSEAASEQAAPSVNVQEILARRRAVG